MDEEKILMDCGLTLTESKVYLILTKLGTSTAYKVAKESNIHKANCYDSLKNLVEKGLVSTTVKDNHILYQITDPNNILDLLKRKEDEIRSILPKLKLMESMVSEKSEAAILKGIPTFMNLLYSLLEYKKPIFVYGIPAIAPQLVKPYIMDFHKERTRRKIQMDHIYNYDAQDRIKFLRKLPYTGARALPKSVESTASTLICGPEVSIQIWLENNVKIIRIIDKDIADSYRSHFKFLWKLAK